MIEALGTRSQATIPMLRAGEPIGAITMGWDEPEAFDDQQVALLQTFADQAVIAIENVRLFNETKEALERQTATAEILNVISNSPTNVQPVFDAIVQSAAHLFAPRNTGIQTLENNLVYMRAMAGPDISPATWEQLQRLYPLPFDANRNMVSRAIAERRVVEVSDSEAPGVPITTAEAGRAANFRSLTLVPLLREGECIGAIALSYPKPGFTLTEKQLSLVKTFADQAVIAIENVRLFNELQARTGALTRSVGQLTALGEVGQAISSTLDLETVLKTIVSRAVQLTGLDGGSIYEYDERAEEFHLRATENVDDEYLAVLRRTPIRKGEGAVGRAGLTGEPVQIPDVRDKGYQTRLRDALIRAGYRAVLVVPLRREEHVIGALSVTRKTPGPFAPEVVELLKTFATQSALAIQNARLFREIAEKGKQLEVASRHKSDFLSSMSHELRTPLNSILGFNEMLLGEVYGEVPADMQAPLAQIQTSGKQLLRLINNVLDLAKIEAGRMELSLQDYSVHDTVESVRSTLRSLAADKGLEFFATLPEDLPLAYGDAGRITQCLMNLAGNSLKFTKAGKVEISVEALGDLLVFKVADTGIGIPPDKIGSLFTEFKQTDVSIASEYGGTGLGLSISRKFVEMHGGRIWVESELGKGSAFIFEIPLRISAGAQT
jgi:signal transduction histidine kinase